MIWLKYWKYLAALGILAAAFVWLKYWGHTKYEAGRADAEMKIQVAVVRQATEAALREAQDEAHLKKVVEDFNAKLAVKDSTVDGLARRLHDYQVRSRAVPQAPGTSEGTSGASGVTGRDEEIGRAAEEVNQACRRDAVRLEAIQEAWKRGPK